MATGQTSATLSYRVGHKVIQVISEPDVFLGKKPRSLSVCDFPTPEPGFVVAMVLSLLDKDNGLLLQKTKHSKTLFLVCAAGGFCKYIKYYKRKCNEIIVLSSSTPLSIET